MYRRPKFLEVLLEIRREMALEADYDVDLFAENARSGVQMSHLKRFQVDPNEDPSQDNSETVKLGASSGA
jgi:hypothetical protein